MTELPVMLMLMMLLASSAAEFNYVTEMTQMYQTEVEVKLSPDVKGVQRSSIISCLTLCHGPKAVKGLFDVCWYTYYHTKKKMCYCDPQVEDSASSVAARNMTRIRPQSTQSLQKCWKRVQKRVSDAVDFYRTWAEYKQSFGDYATNFWIGLDRLHSLTKNGVPARFEVTTFDGEFNYAEYSIFKVDTEANKYKLTIGGHSGPLCDSMAYHNNYKFSTKDADNDVYAGNCAQNYFGAWWYKSCHQVHFNGKYPNSAAVAHGQGFSWNCWKGHTISMKTTEIMVLVDENEN